MNDRRPEDRAGPDGPNVAHRIIRAMFVVLFFWVFWKFGGYIITALVIRRFGSGAVSDAYFFATQAVIYGLIFAPALSILVPAFIPVFVEERGKRGEEAAWRFARTVMGLLLLGCVLMLLVVYACAGPFTDALVSGFGPESRALGVGLLRWLLPGAALMVLFLPLRAILNSYKAFAYPSAAEAAQKLVWVAVFAGTGWLLGIKAVVLGCLVGSLAMVCVCVFGLRDKLGLFRPGPGAMSARRFMKEALVAALFMGGTAAALYGVARFLPEALARYRGLVLITVVLAGVLAYTLHLWVRSRSRAGVMARFAALAVPLVISTFFASYRNVVTFHFQSFTARGVFTDIEAGRRIANFPVELVALALSVAMLPYLCEMASRTHLAALGDVVTKALRMLAAGFVPLTVLTLILAEPLCRLVFDRGDRSAMDLHYTARALQFTAAALVVYAAERVLMQAYFSLQRMWAPALLGIAATLLQVAFLAVPIYALRMDYPTQVFVLVALAYPATRLAKNAALLLILKRHMPVLPARQTLAFVARLAVLSVAVGAAAYGALLWVERALPYERYRQHKVVVDSFDVEAQTWSSAEAEEVRIGPAPGDASHGAAVSMRYGRHGSALPVLVRSLDGLRTQGARRLSFSLYAEQDVPALLTVVSHGAGRPERFTFGSADAPRAGRWQAYSVPLDGTAISSIGWSESPAGGTATGVLYVDDVKLMDAQGQAVFGEDFDRNGWAGAPGTSWVRVTSAEHPYEGYALRLPGGGPPATKDLGPFDLAGTDRLRCRLLNEAAEAAQVRLTLESPDAIFSRTMRLEPGQWQTVELARADLACEEPVWRAICAVSFTTEAQGGPVYLDDLTFRRRAQALRYMLLMLVHCAVPSVAGLAAMAACLAALRFEELGYVVEWVRARGWRRRRAAGEGPADEA